MKTKGFKIISKVITVMLSIITFLLMLLAAYNFFSVKILKKDYSNLFGYTFFEVVSGSMSPAIEKWDLIIVDLDSEYKVGDIISYKKDGVYITHRIIEINKNTIITKGDANNTIDNPITKDMVAGKVVKIYSGGATWIKVFTTPKVIVGSIISLILIIYTMSLFKQEDKKKIEEINELDRLEAGDIMQKIKDNSKLKVKLCILFILLIMLALLIPYTLSRFRTEASADATMDVAFFITKDSYEHKEILLNEMKPGDTYSYNFSVSNFKDGKRSEVNLIYDVEVVATTNLPFEYKLYMTNSGSDVSVVSEEEITEDADGTYFKTLKATSRVHDFNNDYIDYYKLVITFPSEFNNFKYQDVAENIEIRINSKQVLDSDN